jgi:uncharacterized membrane protein
MATREWILKQNCSISPRQLAKAYAVICAASLMVAVFFTMRGAWVVMMFALLELTAVATAFLYFARHATDHEHIALTDNCLKIELVRGERKWQYRFDPHRTKVALPVLRHGLIGLEANGDRIEVGRFLTEWRRREFARELKLELGSYQTIR